MMKGLATARTMRKGFTIYLSTTTDESYNK